MTVVPFRPRRKPDPRHREDWWPTPGGIDDLSAQAELDAIVAAEMAMKDALVAAEVKRMEFELALAEAGLLPWPATGEREDER
jgi:hypothetical protein